MAQVEARRVVLRDRAEPGRRLQALARGVGMLCPRLQDGAPVCARRLFDERVAGRTDAEPVVRGEQLHQPEGVARPALERDVDADTADDLAVGQRHPGDADLVWIRLVVGEQLLRRQCVVVVAGDLAVDEVAHPGELAEVGSVVTAHRCRDVQGAEAELRGGGGHVLSLVVRAGGDGRRRPRARVRDTEGSVGGAAIRARAARARARREGCGGVRDRWRAEPTR